MANKRAAAEEALGASPSKRIHLEALEISTDSYLDDGDDDFTSARTPSSIDDAGSPVTVATTPRPKFPSDLKTLVCNWPGCTKSFNRPARLRDHLNSHTNSRPFKCPYEDCDKDYIEDKHLKQHIKAVHTHERKHVCQREGCGKSFVTGTRLKRHQAVHEGADRFRCQDCGQSFRKKETLNKHVRKDHQGLRAHACPEPGCDAAFDSKPALKRHRDKEHGDLKFWCGECALQASPDGTQRRVGFTTELLLQAHLKTEHQTCLFCDFKSTSKWELDKHVELHHSGKSVEERKTHGCPRDGCGKKFTTKSNLTTHIRTAHEGLRFVCGEFVLTGPLLDGWTNDQGCGGQFVTKLRLEDHIRFVHLKQERPRLSKVERPQNAEELFDEISGVMNEAKKCISCPHCEEVFIRYSDLTVHMDTQHDPTNMVAGDAGAFFDDQINPEAHPMLDYAGHMATEWANPEEETFSAEMYYGPLGMSGSKTRPTFCCSRGNLLNWAPTSILLSHIYNRNKRSLSNLRFLYTQSSRLACMNDPREDGATIYDL
ncbi:hypothetical protein B0I35DRAFT_473290 [Stachybotrys elegans]|uniref:C2H2-type domain-containing protein n=1 Tax=Stachybotrys elegans TaxID=80388 RepID=A0A8K0WXL0_9HYPO|nr:hypothetical protein B0I35DRAFT_473290 [Stachybotrys elegans]